MPIDKEKLRSDPRYADMVELGEFLFDEVEAKRAKLKPKPKPKLDEEPPSPKPDDEPDNVFDELFGGLFQKKGGK